MCQKHFKMMMRNDKLYSMKGFLFFTFILAIFSIFMSIKQNSSKKMEEASLQLNHFGYSTVYIRGFS
jgi:hypothetical protein